jgi:hypothetical protein
VVTGFPFHIVHHGPLTRPRVHGSHDPLPIHPANACAFMDTFTWRAGWSQYTCLLQAPSSAID